MSLYTENIQLFLGSKRLINRIPLYLLPRLVISPAASHSHNDLQKKTNWTPVLEVHFYTANLSHVTVMLDRPDTQPQNSKLAQRNKTKTHIRSFNQREILCKHNSGSAPTPVHLPRDVVFPVVDRPLGSELYPGPRDPRLYLSLLGYEIDRCIAVRTNVSSEVNNTNSLYYKSNESESHSLYYKSRGQQSETDETVVEVSCDQLNNTSVPLVSHSLGPWRAWCMEELSVRSEVIRSFARSAKNIVKC